MTFCKWVAAGLALGLAVPASAGEAEIAAAIADPHRAETNRELDEGRMPAALLGFAEIQPGDVVADFMAGSGYYSELIADLVGDEGRVYAINVDNFFEPEKWEGIAAAHPNVRNIVVRPRAMLLAPHSLDMIFSHLTFHDLFWESDKYQFPRLDPDYMVANWFEAVKPGGTVIVVDHIGPAGDPREVTDRLHRIDPDRVKRMMLEAGFVLEAQSSALRRSDDDIEKIVFDESVRGKTDRFAMKFRKPD